MQLPFFEGGRETGGELEELIAAKDPEQAGREMLAGGVEEECAVGGFAGDEFNLDECDGGSGGGGL